MVKGGLLDKTMEMLDGILTAAIVLVVLVMIVNIVEGKLIQFH